MSEYTIQRCPVCDGAGCVSRPPWVPRDATSWTGVSTGPCECPTCFGDRVVRINVNGVIVGLCDPATGKRIPAAPTADRPREP